MTAVEAMTLFMQLQSKVTANVPLTDELMKKKDDGKICIAGRYHE